MKRFDYTCIALMLGVTAGCARFQSQPIVPAETAASLEARSLAALPLREFLETNLARHFESWPPASWDFEMLYLAALYYHPSLDLARAQWQVALGGNKTAAARPNPTLNAEPGYDLSASGGLSPWIPLVTFDLPIETAGKRGYRIARARQLSESARLNIASTAWQVRSNLRSSLIDFAAARRKVLLLEKQQSIQERIVQLLEQQLQAGAVSSSELTLVRIALDQIRLDLYDARQLSADTRVRVADAVGMPVQALEGVELAYDLAVQPTTALDLLSLDARRQALESRSDILAALAEYAASQSALQLEIARQYPDIHFGPSYQYDQGDHKISLILSAELPLLNQNQGPIAEALAKRTEAAARFNALQAKVITEIDRAATAYRVAQGNISTLEDLAAAQQKRSDAVAAQQRAGAADQVDLLNSQIELGTSQLLELNGRVKLQQSYAALEDAVQRPLQAALPRLIEQTQRPQSIKASQP